MKKRIKIKDVALEAGVSPAAVSTVLNNKVGDKIRVSKENQENILQAAAKLGYVPNPAAQNLVSGRSRILSIFSYEAVFPFAAESEFYTFLLGIEKKAEKTAYDILLLTNSNKSFGTSLNDQAYLSRLKLGDGGILIGIKKHTDTLLRLIDDGFPLVFIGRREIEGRNINIVTFDYRPIIKELIQYACNMGHKKTLYLKLNGNEEPFIDRQNALDAALEHCPQMDCKSIYFDDTINESYIHQIIEAGITLLFVERKSIVSKLKDLLESCDLIPGKDLSVILFEDQWFKSDIEWTCWSNERATVGMKAVELLDEIILHKQETHVIKTIVPHLIEGASLANIN